MAASEREESMHRHESQIVVTMVDRGEINMDDRDVAIVESAHHHTIAIETVVEVGIDRDHR